MDQDAQSAAVQQENEARELARLQKTLAQSGGIRAEQEIQRRYSGDIGEI